MKNMFYLFLFFIFCSCQSSSKPNVEEPMALEMSNIQEEKVVVEIPQDTTPIFDYDTTEWTDVGLLNNSIVMDLRYATNNNFVDTQMYECGRCFLRPAVAEAIINIHQQLQAEGYGLKMYDCYRPRPIQWALWEKSTRSALCSRS